MGLIVKLTLLSLAVGCCLAYDDSPAYKPRGTRVMIAPVMAAIHEELPKPYTHGYNVDDGYNNRIHHNEDSDALGNKRGSYGYTNAEGLYRTVNYVADNQGFRAQIVSNEPGLGAEASADVGMKVNPVPASIKAEMELLRVPMHQNQMQMTRASMKPSTYGRMMNMQPASMKPSTYGHMMNMQPASMKPSTYGRMMNMQPSSMKSAYQPKVKAMHVTTQPQIQDMQSATILDLPMVPNMKPMMVAMKPMSSVPQIMNSAPMMADSYAPARQSRMQIPSQQGSWMAPPTAAKMY